MTFKIIHTVTQKQTKHVSRIHTNFRKFWWNTTRIHLIIEFFFSNICISEITRGRVRNGKFFTQITAKMKRIYILVPCKYANLLIYLVLCRGKNFTRHNVFYTNDQIFRSSFKIGWNLDFIRYYVSNVPTLVLGRYFISSPVR